MDVRYILDIHTIDEYPLYLVWLGVTIKTFEKSAKHYNSRQLFALNLYNIHKQFDYFLLTTKSPLPQLYHGPLFSTL